MKEWKGFNRRKNGSIEKLYQVKRVSAFMVYSEVNVIDKDYQMLEDKRSLIPDDCNKDALCIGVESSLSLEFTSAPFSINIFMHSTFPLKDAFCRAVLPLTTHEKPKNMYLIKILKINIIVEVV